MTFCDLFLIYAIYDGDGGSDRTPRPAPACFLLAGPFGRLRTARCPAVRRTAGLYARAHSGLQPYPDLQRKRKSWKVSCQAAPASAGWQLRLDSLHLSVFSRKKEPQRTLFSINWWRWWESNPRNPPSLFFFYFLGCAFFNAFRILLFLIVSFYFAHFHFFVVKNVVKFLGQLAAVLQIIS